MASNQQTIHVVSEKTCSVKKSFLWKIPNFAEMLKSPDVLEAQSFSFQMGEKIGLPTEWGCYLQAKKDEKENIKTVGIYAELYDYPGNLTELHVNVRFQIKDPQKDSYFLDRNYNQNMIESGAYGYSKVFLPNSASRDLPLQADGSVEILVTITLFNLNEDKPRCQLMELLADYKVKFEENLWSDMAKARENPTNVKHQKTKFVSNDGKEIIVDRVVLAARSNVFLEMFLADVAEEESGTVKVGDMNGESLSVLLEFCHTAKLKNNWEEVGVIEDLFYGAQKYNLEDLKEFLGQTVALVCKNDNFRELFSLARKFEMKEAKSKLFQYFKANMTTDVEEMEKFMEAIMRQLENPGEEDQLEGPEKQKPQGCVFEMEVAEEAEPLHQVTENKFDQVAICMETLLKKQESEDDSDKVENDEDEDELCQIV